MRHDYDIHELCVLHVIKVIGVSLDSYANNVLNYTL